MKTTIFSTLLAAAALAACDDDGIRVDPVVDEAFRGLYPGATRVEWERNMDHCVAEFRRGRNDAEAWFTHAGVWCMTETDISYAELPQAVRTAFEQGDYAAWRVDDVDMLEYPDRQTVYVVEVESGNAERDLYYTPDGILFKTRPDTNATAPGNGTGGGSGNGTGTGNDTGGGSGNGTGNGQHTPASVLPAVKAFIAQRYPE
ncbi:MAG: PepSY-like domain-containing protein, partial [Alistipes sp.]|nr:PepSY-like domain-containing protein [Alistipes sp.]